MDKQTESALGTLLRHGLSTAGGALVAKGVMSAAMVEPITGVALTLASLFLSRKNAKPRRRAKKQS
jgi:hypothetical protein